jgi:hypothetical protein
MATSWCLAAGNDLHEPHNYALKQGLAGQSSM